MSKKRALAPAEKDLLALPILAQVALVARCARRVQPLFDAWKGAEPEHIEAVERAITVTEVLAADTHVSVNSQTVYAAAVQAADAGQFARETTGVTAATIAASAKATAVRAALTGYAAFVSDATALAVHAAAAVAVAVRAANAAATANAAVWSDFDRLCELSKTERWTDTTPVDVARLGPLWPFGKPKGWPVAEDVSAEPPVMQVDIVVPAGMTPQQSRDFNERVAKFYAAMSGLHAAMGGTGLRILDEGSCEMMPAEDEAPHESSSNRPLVGAGGVR